MHARLTLWTALLLGCPGADTDSDAPPDTDTDGLVDYSVDCEGRPADLGITTGGGECVQATELEGGTALTVRADCTDEAITGHLDKPHLVMVPDRVTQDALWLHLGGSGGQPTNSQNLGNAAVGAGYRFVSVAYLNEPSISARCSCPDGPRPASCEEVVRLEILYGDDVTPWLEMPRQESIAHRLGALLATLHERRPEDGWDQYLDNSGSPEWTRIAVSGFSQGGGMAGLIARDHAVPSALFLSKGAGSVLELLVDPSTAQACSTHQECGGGRCCPVAELGETCEPSSTAENLCLVQVPSPWASTGKDVDGDGLGDGGPDTRATPPERSVGLVHRDEGAWSYSPDVFAGWGLGSRDDYVDADSARAPFSAEQRLFSTGLPPRGSCSEHQSIGADACQPRRDGRPAMLEVWQHAMLP